MRVSGSFLRGIAVLAVSVSCVSVNAAFKTETENFTLPLSSRLSYSTNGTVVNDTFLSADPFQDLTFDKFEPGLGTLLGVEVTFRSEFRHDVRVDAIFIRSPNSDIEFGSVGESVLSVSSAMLTQVSLTRNISVDCTVGSPSLSCPRGAVSLPIDFERASPGMGLANGVASFVGSGTFEIRTRMASTIGPRVDGETTLSDNASMTGNYGALWSGAVTVRYEYEPKTTGVVPEPATLLLLLAGLGGAAALRRRAR